MMTNLEKQMMTDYKVKAEYYEAEYRKLREKIHQDHMKCCKDTLTNIEKIIDSMGSVKNKLDGINNSLDDTLEKLNDREDDKHE